MSGKVKASRVSELFLHAKVERDHSLWDRPGLHTEVPAVCWKLDMAVGAFCSAVVLVFIMGPAPSEQSPYTSEEPLPCLFQGP